MGDIARLKVKLEDALDVSISEIPIDLVVMGPGLEETTPAAILRRKIIKEAAKYGATIEPEHPDLIEISEKKLAGGHHLTAYEMHLVDISDLVVIIPDSPGSFCELGLFATYTAASQKMLVLTSEDYPREGTYVADGPLTAARHNLAEVHFVDYTDFAVSWALVESRLQKIRAERVMRTLTGRSK